jgi:hypothetical protein
VLNERWSGSYTMVCDVIFDNRTILNVSAEFSESKKDIDVFFPAGLSLTPDEEGKIASAVLWQYYGIGLHEGEERLETSTPEV